MYLVRRASAATNCNEGDVVMAATDTVIIILTIRYIIKFRFRCWFVIDGAGIMKG